MASKAILESYRQQHSQRLWNLMNNCKPSGLFRPPKLAPSFLRLQPFFVSTLHTFGWSPADVVVVDVVVFPSGLLGWIWGIQTSNRFENVWKGLCFVDKCSRKMLIFDSWFFSSLDSYLLLFKHFWYVLRGSFILQGKDLELSLPKHSNYDACKRR